MHVARNAGPRCSIECQTCREMLSEAAAAGVSQALRARMREHLAGARARSAFGASLGDVEALKRLRADARLPAKDRDWLLAEAIVGAIYGDKFLGKAPGAAAKAAFEAAARVVAAINRHFDLRDNPEAL